MTKEEQDDLIGFQKKNVVIIKNTRDWLIQKGNEL